MRDLEPSRFKRDRKTGEVLQKGQTREVSLAQSALRRVLRDTPEDKLEGRLRDLLLESKALRLKNVGGKSAREVVRIVSKWLGVQFPPPAPTLEAARCCFNCLNSNKGSWQAFTPDGMCCAGFYGRCDKSSIDTTAATVCADFVGWRWK